MLSVNKLIQSAYECLGWPYVSPGSNDANGIDCSGLFVKIFRDQGAKIYHGSNTIYRDCCDPKGPITSVSQLKPGYAVFKWKSTTPSKFNDGLGDFCHIGLVVSTNPLKIIHASSTAGCVTEDTKLGKWKYWGALKDVDYNDDVSEDILPEPEIYATVFSENRKPVKMRNKPSTSCRLYDELAFGTIVKVVKKGEPWTEVDYGLRKGWFIQSKFLLIDEESINPSLGHGFTVEISGLSESEADELLRKYPSAVKSCG